MDLMYFLYGMRKLLSLPSRTAPQACLRCLLHGGLQGAPEVALGSNLARELQAHRVSQLSCSTCAVPEGHGPSPASGRRRAGMSIAHAMKKNGEAQTVVVRGIPRESADSCGVPRIPTDYFSFFIDGLSSIHRFEGRFTARL